MMHCGLLGRKLSHSYSPQIHAMLADYRYELFEREPEELEHFFKSENWDGINVTVPYKKSVIPYLDELTPIAKRLGAVNTIVRRNGRLIGHNTDYYGFRYLLGDLAVTGETALVLGSGGASNTVCAVLEDLGADVTVVSRTGKHNYQNLHLHRDATILVNTTPVGMFPGNGACPVSLDQFPKLKIALDVIYNPARTQFLLDAQAHENIHTRNGLGMLVAQAMEACEWFTDTPIPNESIVKIEKQLSAEMENVILIGMPGCGKSTIGKLLAAKTGRKFVDADEEIIKLAHRSIPDIFAQDGEAVFRDMETKVLTELGKQSGLIIATGGGCVTKERNYPLLHQNGRIFWIIRDTSKLSTEGRPLSQDGHLEQMYRIREPLYRQFRDYTVANNGSPAEAAAKILSILEA